MASVDPVSADAATGATPPVDANNATTLPPVPERQHARRHCNLAQEDESRLLALGGLRKPNLAFAILAAHGMGIETRPVSVDDPELARRGEEAWLKLFEEASSDGARQELRDTLDKHLSGKPPPLHKSWSMLAEEAEIEEWYDDAAFGEIKDITPFFANKVPEAKGQQIVDEHCTFLGEESFYKDKRRIVDTYPFLSEYGRQVAENGDRPPDAPPTLHREHECPVQAWRQLFQDARPGVVDGALLGFERAKLKLEDEARWERLKTMPLDELDALLFALTDAHGPTQFEREWYGEDARDQAKRVVLELFAGVDKGNAVRACFDAAKLPAEGKVIQGGVLFRGGHAQKLKAKLEAHRYTNTSHKFAAYLFCNRDGHWEAAALGLQTFQWPCHFDSCNIRPVELHDPTPDKPWDKKALEVFYSIVDDVRDQLAAGKVVVVACMMGMNRSKAVLHALHPTAANEPTCEAMRRAAEGYRNGKDMRIVPLMPKMAIGKRRR